MKIFNFENGKKGELLTTVSIPNHCHGWNTSIGKIGSIGKFTFAIDGGKDIGSVRYSLKELVEKLNVNAICYCIGEITCGAEKPVWEWMYTCAPEYAVKIGADVTVIN
ncbi:MAG: hypothetical protein ACUZ8H_02230 [Candidatus Anammoxibacter sp.]